MHADTARSRNPLATTLTIGAAALLSLILVAAMVFTVTQAAFTDTTSNTGNNWDAGTVVISDDAEGTAIFNAQNIVPGYSESKTLEVTNESSVDTEVTFDVDVTDDGLAAFLEVTVTRGADTVFDGTLDELLTFDPIVDTTLATTAGGGDVVVVYDVAVSFPLGQEDVNNAQGKSSQVDFSWTAQSVAP